MHLFITIKVLVHVSLLFSLSFLVEAEGFDGWRFGNNATVELLSPWLKKMVEDNDDNGFPKPDCSGKQIFCRKGEDGVPGKKKIMKCCKHRCVDVGFDVNNCGFCGKSCSFPRQCCRGFCVDTNRSKFNCGKCGNKCPFLVRCVYGMCGYGQPDPRRPPKGRWKPHPPKDHPRPPPEDQSSSFA